MAPKQEFKRQQSWSEKNLRNPRTLPATVILSVVTVILLIVLLVFTVQWKHAREAGLKAREQMVCVECGSLPEPYPGKNDSEQCCVKTSVLLNDLIRKYSKQKFEETATTRMLNNYANTTCLDLWEPIAVTLTGIHRTAPALADGSMVHFYPDQAMNESHFTYENGMLRVLITGHYHVYSQINIRHPDGVSDVTYSHSVHHVTTDGTLRKILESHKSNCEPVSQLNELTLAHGAVFKLHQGDNVYVSVSHPDNLSPNKTGHYFGMYNIDNPGAQSVSQ